jgi:hypothetical protein
MKKALRASVCWKIIFRGPDIINKFSIKLDSIKTYNPVSFQYHVQTSEFVGLHAARVLRVLYP